MQIDFKSEKFIWDPSNKQNIVFWTKEEVQNILEVGGKILGKFQFHFFFF